jgi:hypothetical protein
MPVRGGPLFQMALVVTSLAMAGCIGSNGPASDEGTAAEPESGILTGRLTATGTSNTQPIAITSTGHSRLAIVLVLSSNLPESEVSLNVTGPAGRSAEVDAGPLLYALPGNRPAISFAAPETGDWPALIELEGGVAADYEVHWCADSLARPGPSGNLACQRGYT